MNPFVRFVLTLLVAGILMNFTLVLLADRRGITAQEQSRDAAKAALVKRLDVMSGRFRQAHIAVEKQEIGEIDSESTVTKSTLLIRRYILRGDADEPPRPPLVRVEIPGDKLHLDGLMLDFSSNFANPQDDATIFRGRQLLFFHHVFGEGQKGDDPFAFLQDLEVPEAMRIYPGQAHPTYYEMLLWHHLWDRIDDPNRNNARDAGLTIKVIDAKPFKVERGKAYLATITADGISLAPDSTQGLLRDMQEEAKQMDEAARNSADK